jgi:ubiquitin C-terminal hydrolase
MNITDKNYIENGYTGLVNLGNTCFLNSCVQILTHTVELHQIFKNPVVQTKMVENRHTDDSRILIEWKALAELMWSGNGVVNPLKFVKTVHDVATRKNVEIFTGWAQNDVTEFLRFIVNCFHTAIARPVKVNMTGKPKTDMDNMAIKCCELLTEIYKTEYSEIGELFYGISVTEIKDVSKKICSQKPEHYFIIDLPIPDKGTRRIQPPTGGLRLMIPCSQNKEAPLSNVVISDAITIFDCFDLFMQPELMTGENQWFNETTGQKEDVTKRMYMWSLPKILIITLKRFAVNEKGRISRINDQVECPLTNLDLSKYVEGYDKKKYVYELYAVSNHSGNPSGGHYTSYIKTARGWVHYNDGHLEAIGEDKIISPSSYCLFMRRTDLHSHK